MTDLHEVANFRTRMEAETAADVLANAGIAALIQSQEGWTLSPISPGATVLVNPEDVARALEVLEAMAAPDDD